MKIIHFCLPAFVISFIIYGLLLILTMFTTNIFTIDFQSTDVLIGFLTTIIEFTIVILLIQILYVKTNHQIFFRIMIFYSIISSLLYIYPIYIMPIVNNLFTFDEYFVRFLANPLFAVFNIMVPVLANSIFITIPLLIILIFLKNSKLAAILK